MKKRILSFLLSAAIFVSMIPWQTIARAATTGGSCGENVTWTFEETTGTLTISGTGDMTDYVTPPWSSHKNSITAIIIESGVTSIGSKSFQYCKNLTSVTIPDTVIDIGQKAFLDCTSLASIAIPDSVESFGLNVFEGCTSLNDVTLSANLSTIAYRTFYGCSGLTNITIPGTVTTIDEAAFEDCTNLASVTILDGVTTIGSNAFDNCINMTSISIPDSVTSIGAYAFNYCVSLSDVSIPDRMTYLGEGAFRYCASLESISIPDSVTTIAQFTFLGCSGLTSITIPASVTSFSTSALYYCKNLTNIVVDENNAYYSSDGGSVLFNKDKTTLHLASEALTSYVVPDTVTQIAGCGFYFCRSLASVTIPDGVTSIGENAFFCCSSLTSISIPVSMTSIDDGAFASCNALQDVYFVGTEVDWEKISIGSNNSCLLNATIHYNSTMPSDEVYSELRYYHAWNEQEQRVYFGPDDISGCLITDETDSVFRDNPALLVGKLVVVEYKIVNKQEILLTMSEATEIPEAQPFTFRFTGNLAPDRDVTSTCYYTDGYFLMDSEIYNAHLATMSLCFELTTWSRSGDSGAMWSKDCAISANSNHRAQNAYDLLITQLGFEKFMMNEAWLTAPTKDSIGAVAATKVLPDGSRLIAVGIRGGGYTREWASNFTMGMDGEHTGFAEAKAQVQDFLKYYIETHQISGPVKLWIVGYSRGGCVANMVAGELNKDPSMLGAATVAHDDLFCYTFSAPQGSLRALTAVGDHSNIHNVINLNDIVPLVAPSCWNFDRYSADRFLPTSATTDSYSDYLTAFRKMINIYMDFTAVEEGAVVQPEYNVKDYCVQYDLVLRWENAFNLEKSVIAKHVYHVPAETILRESTDFIFNHAIGSREDYYRDLEVGIRQLLSILMAEPGEEDAAAGSRELTSEEFFTIIFEELVEKDRIFEIVEPMCAINLDSFETRKDKVYDRLSDFVREVLNNSDLWGTVLFVANLKDTLTDILWRILEGVLEDVYYKDMQTLEGLINFPGALSRAFQAHCGEVTLAWIMSQDSYYNPAPTDSGASSSRIIRINCPVDVKVYRVRTGELVAAITNDVAQDISGSSIYAYLTPDGEKTIVLPSDAEYSIEITATADSTFNYTISEYSWVSQSNSRILSYRDVPISEGDVLKGTIPEFTEKELSDGAPNGSSAEYVLTGTDGAEIELDKELNGEAAAEAFYTVSVISNVANGGILGGGTYTYGSFAQVEASPLPDEEFLGWYEGNTLVSRDTAYRFMVTRDVNLVARFTGAPAYGISLDAEIVGDATSAWVDGVEHPITRAGDQYYVDIEGTTATNLVIYTYNDPNAEDVHTQYPVGMKVWMLTFEDGAYTATYVPEFDDLLQYSGSSIRIVGVKGIRMITSITKSNKQALTGKGLAGYTLVEYGTALAWASDVENGNGLLLGEEYTKSNYAYRKGVADPVFKTTNTLMQYTNVLVGFSDDQCIPDIAMRPYIILEDAEGNQVTIYGGVIYRSVGYIAYQNRNAFKPGTNAYEYVWGIIHHVYGEQFDADYKG